MPIRMAPPLVAVVALASVAIASPAPASEAEPGVFLRALRHAERMAARNTDFRVTPGRVARPYKVRIHHFWSNGRTVAAVVLGGASTWVVDRVDVVDGPEAITITVWGGWPNGTHLLIGRLGFVRIPLEFAPGYRDLIDGSTGSRPPRSAFPPTGNLSGGLRSKH